MYLDRQKSQMYNKTQASDSSKKGKDKINRIK